MLNFLKRKLHKNANEKSVLPNEESQQSIPNEAELEDTLQTEIAAESGISTYEEESPEEIAATIATREPVEFNAVQEIADLLLNKHSVLVNLRQLTSPDAKKMLNFLNGIIYAISGSVSSLGQRTYFYSAHEKLTPAEKLLCTTKSTNFPSVDDSSRMQAMNDNSEEDETEQESLNEEESVENNANELTQMVDVKKFNLN